MPFRDIFVFGVVLLLLPTSFRRPFVGLALFSWLAYMRPQDLCWGFARSMRFSFYVAAAMFVGWYVNESHKRRFYRPELRSALLLAMAVLITLSLLFAGQYDEQTGQYYVEYLKIIAIAIFTISQVDSRHRLRIILWVICTSLAFYSVKNGVMGILRGGAPILQGPGGMMEDNNDFALALVMNLPLLHYLPMLEKNRLLVRACNVAIALSIITILLTHSRGGFLAMVATILWIAFRSGRILQAGGTLFALVILFFLFAPESVIERIISIGHGRADDSAASRLDSWALAFRMWADNPLWGVGLRNYLLASGEYVLGHAGHVAHSSYLQILAEGGAFAFVVYMTLLLSVFVTASRMRRMAALRADMSWAGVYGRMFEATIVGFLVGSTFLNRGHFDLIYHFVALVGCAAILSRRAFLAVAVPSEDPHGHRAGGPVSVRGRPAHAAQDLPQWGRTT